MFYFKTAVLLLITLLPSVDKYPYSNSMPTKNGIRYYIEQNKNIVVKQLEDFIGDTLYSYDIRVDDLSDYQNYDSLEAGRFYPDDEIIITDELKFQDYELKFVPKWKQKQYDANNRFVKAVLIHELVHLYIYQVVNDNISTAINPEYLNFTSIRTSGFGSTFIEEGICEYVVNCMHENINCNTYVPKSTAEIRDEKNRRAIMYIYSQTFVKPYIDSLGFKKALINILTSKPPSYEELLKPELYYGRLDK